MGITRHRYAAPVALCALVLAGSCSKSPTQQINVGGVGVSPSAITFGSLNATRQLMASVTDQSGNPITGASVTWSSDNINVALVGGGGLVTAIGNGVATITATSGSKSGTATVTVQQVVASVTKQGGDGQSWAVNATLPQALVVLVADSGGSAVESKAVNFAVVSGGGSLVEHSAFTNASGYASVHWTLGSTVGSQSASATVSPISPITFTANAGTPGAASQIAEFAGDGQTGLNSYPLNFPPAVIVKDAGGLPVSGVQVVFAVASGGGSVTGDTATTNGNGVAAVGSWTVQNGANSLTATAAGGGSITSNPVTFNATGQTGQYNVEVTFIYGAFTATQTAAVDSAAARWQRIVYQPVGPVQVTFPSGFCFSDPHVPSINESINSVHIYVAIETIDGPNQTLAEAGPCIIREPGLLPAVGLVILDSADIGPLETAGALEDVLQHEIAHILGFGTIWDAQDLNLIVDPAENGGADPHFVGPKAIASFYQMGGVNYTGGAAVPVENVGAVGTIDGHWRESVFHTELMTGTYNGGVPNPLSVLTIASMADEGYTVNYAAADPYNQTFSLRAAGAPTGTTIHLVNDVLHGPLYVLNSGGQVMRVIQR